MKELRKNPLIETRSVTRILPGPVPVTLVRDIDMHLDAGEFVAITGPSGSGKSSLLYLLGLLDRPTEGEIWVEGRNTGMLDEAELAQLRLEKMGFVFQFHFLLPEFTALENVVIPMRKLGHWTASEQRRRAVRVLAEMGMAEHQDKRPDQLSGGERQRVAVARALANDPLLILADEPTGNLDSANARRVFDLLASLAHEQGKCIAAITHDPDLAALTDRQIHTLDGRIVDSGPIAA